MQQVIRILLADDDADDRELFCLALGEIYPGCLVKTVNNGAKAVKYLEQCDVADLPHAILLDFNMPQMTGACVLEWLLSRPGLAGIPSFVISTSSSETDRTQCLSLGATAYFIKPSHIQEIRQVVECILDHIKLQLKQ